MVKVLLTVLGVLIARWIWNTFKSKAGKVYSKENAYERFSSR